MRMDTGSSSERTEHSRGGIPAVEEGGIPVVEVHEGAKRPGMRMKPHSHTYACARAHTRPESERASEERERRGGGGERKSERAR